MAGKLKNIANLFVNTKTRIIIFFTIFLILVAVGASYFSLKSRFVKPSGSADIAEVPGEIQSIPGSFSPTEQYAKLQTKENVLAAESALKKGTSAIPTIIRSKKSDADDTFSPDTSAQGGAGFSALLREQKGGSTPKQLAVDELKSKKCDQDSIKKARALGFSSTELKNSGCTVLQLKNAGFDAASLREAGFSACDLKDAGFTPQQLLDAGYTSDELKGAGFPLQQIQNAQARDVILPPGVNSAQLAAANCDVTVLKQAREAGVKPATLKRITGCSANALKQAGYSIADLKKAGISAKELLGADVSPALLKENGFSDGDIKAAQDALQQEGAGLPKGFSSAALKKAGCGKEAVQAAKKAGITAETLKNIAGCTAQQLAAGDYTAAELKKAGFNTADLKRAGFNAQQLKDAGFDPNELKNAGFSARELKSAGLNAQQLKDAGFSAAQLKVAGFSAQQLKDAGLNASDLKAAGFDAKDLQNAGFTTQQLKNAGFTANDLKNAGFNAKQLQDAGFNANELSSVGVNVPITAPMVSPNQPGDRNLQQLMQRQAMQLSEQQQQQKINEFKTGMQGQAQQLFTSWQSPVQAYVAGSPDEQKNAKGKSGSGLGNEQGIADSGKIAIKAGDIMFGVLNTAVNSDEPGPVLATLVSGPFKGAKLIGSLSTGTRQAQKVILSFNLMSVPQQNKSVSINAVAIDPKTARTALSSNTDNHYLERYGFVFASSFLEGLGQATSDSGRTIIPGSSGQPNVVDQPALTSEQKSLVALGKVGEKLGSTAIQGFNRPPTIQVYSGVGVGILFMSDVQISSIGSSND